MKYAKGLSESFLKEYANKTPPWGPVGYVTYKRTYARLIPELGRTEEWTETCARVCNGLIELGGLFTQAEIEELFEAMFHLRGMTSGRALWQLGSHTVRRVGADSIQNCWFVTCNRLDAFCFTFNQLMLGGGVGFSVLPEHVYELPKVLAKVEIKRVDTPDCDFVVPDNREGWVELLHRILEAFFVTGKNFYYSTQCIRPAGSPISGFGGTASGSESLVKGLGEIIRILQSRAGQKLRPIDCMDVMNLIGAIVVAGNVRRSSEISIGHPHDRLFLDAKNWSKFTIPNWRVMSNNSVAADSIDELLPEFWDGYKGEGEPYGLINLRNCRRFGRLADGVDYRPDYNVEGVNPCVTGDTWVHTYDGPRQVSDLIGVPFKAAIRGGFYASTSDGFFPTGERRVFEVRTVEGYRLRGTIEHLLETVELGRKSRTTEWTAIGDLNVGDLVSLPNHRGLGWWADKGNGQQGWLLGYLIGNGTFDDRRAILQFWGEHKLEMFAQAAQIAQAQLVCRSDLGTADPQGKCVLEHDKIGFASVDLARLASQFGVLRSKRLTSAIEQTTEDFHCGLLRGWFDADGSPNGDQEKGVSVRLCSSIYDNLLIAQRMLARLGIISTIYENRRPAGPREMPGGIYDCEAIHDLVIANDNLFVFAEMVGFTKPDKAARLAEALANYKRKPNRERFVATVKEVVQVGIEPVFDCTIPDVGCFDANGIVAHNCAEITLCNHEPCNLADIYLPNIRNAEEFKKVAVLLYKACKTISNAKFSDPETERIVHHNHRIGVGLTGFMQVPKKQRTAEILTEVYRALEECDQEYSQRLGCRQSIKFSTMKPSGTLSLLPGVTPGMHAAFAPHLIRRIRFSASDPLVEVCRNHGYHVEPKLELDGTHDTNTMVVSFPVKMPAAAVFEKDVTVIDELETQKFLQTYWADNSISATHYFKKGELKDIKEWLGANYESSVKTCSFLLSSGHGFAQAPLEAISEEQFAKMSADTKPITKIVDDQEINHLDNLECAGGSCPVK